LLVRIKGHKDVVRFLMGRGCDTEACDSNSWTPLTCGAVGGHAAVIRQLLTGRCAGGLAMLLECR
ncbi:unnamed protein product, partial [Phaeothamnion confervicola]